MIDISRLSPMELERFIHLQGIVARQANDADRVRALRLYYDGEHPVLLTTRQQEYLGPLVSGDEFTFAHNLVKSVVDTLRERLNVTGFSTTDDAEDNAPEAQAASLLWQWWEANKMPSQQIRHYRRALRDGMAYIIVAWDNTAQRPVISLHKLDAGDQEPGVILHRDPEDENVILYATRYFYTFNPLEPGATGRQRKTVYLPGEIRKYIMGKGGAWEEYQDDGDASWPLPWVDSTGQPLGVPVFEFANPGGSEVSQIIGLQNLLNKTWLDIAAAADTNGFPLLAVEYNTNGQPIVDDPDLEGNDELRLSPGRAIEVDDATVKRLEPSNLDPMLNVMRTVVQTIGGVSRTPSYYLMPVGGSDVPSGEALKQLESGLVKRAMERQLVFGQSWSEVMTFCYRLALTFGRNIPQAQVDNVNVTWEDPNVRNELTEAQTATIHKGLNVPDDVLWLRIGYTPEQIAAFKRQQQLDEATKIATIAGQLRNAQQATQTQGANNGGTSNTVQGNADNNDRSAVGSTPAIQ